MAEAGEGPACPLPGSRLGNAIVERQGLVLGLVAALVILGYLAAMFAATEGHFVAQVTDLYLICQYARAAAEGHPFQYVAGEPATTGATSLLHTLVLAVADAIGLRGEGLVAFAIALGAASYLAAIQLARRIALQLATPRESALAGLLVALGGPLVWAFLYGSDIALFMTLSLFLVDAMLRAWRRGDPAPLVAPGVLLALARPEGLPIALATAAAWHFGPARTAAVPRGRRLLPLLAVGTGLALLVLNKALTGMWVGTSVADKSLFASYGWPDGIALVGEYVVDVVRGLLLGLYPSQTPIGFGRGWAPYFFTPLALALVPVAVHYAQPSLAAALKTWLAIVTCMLVLLAPNMFMGSHFNRYLMWALPSLHVLTAVGLGYVCVRLEPRAGMFFFRVAAAVMIALGALSTIRFAVTYGDLAGDVYRRDLAAARWISTSLPKGVRIANLATSVEYLTGHRSVNLHGVTSPTFFGNRPAEREAGVFEALARIPEADRPPYVMLTASALEAYPSMRHVIGPAPLFQTSSFSDEILIYAMKYDLVGQNRTLRLPESLQAVRGLQEVDRLNVCDSADELAHGYSFRSASGSLRLSGLTRAAVSSDGGVLVDAGRVILGHERFRIHTQPGQALMIVLRTAPEASANILRAAGTGQYSFELPESALTVRVDGAVAARPAFRPRSGWDEVIIRIPRGVISGERAEIEISGRYAAFYYWFFQ